MIVRHAILPLFKKLFALLIIIITMRANFIIEDASPAGRFTNRILTMKHSESLRYWLRFGQHARTPLPARDSRAMRSTGNEQKTNPAKHALKQLERWSYRGLNRWADALNMGGNLLIVAQPAQPRNSTPSYEKSIG